MIKWISVPTIMNVCAVIKICKYYINKLTIVKYTLILAKNYFNLDYISKHLSKYILCVKNDMFIT